MQLGHHSRGGIRDESRTLSGPPARIGEFARIGEPARIGGWPRINGLSELLARVRE